MERYKLDGSSDNVGWPAGDLLNEALTGMSLFYGRDEHR
jgi:hypothetical protein